MMKKYYILVLLLTIGALLLTSFGQSKVKKSQLVKLFKQSINQESRKSISIGSGAWTICNQDSAFFKSDTIKVYSNHNYFYQKSTCCNFINWTFYQKDKFIQSSSKICNEPATASIKVAYFKLAFLTGSDTLRLAVVNYQKLVDIFNVISIDEIKLANNGTCSVITLKRCFDKSPVNKIQ